MAGGLDKGLSSSIWSPVSTGLPPYRFKKQTRTSALATPSPSPAVAAAAASSSSSSSPLAAAAAAYASSPVTPSSKTTDTPSSITTGGTSTTAATTPSPTSNGTSKPQGNDLLAAALNRIPTPWAELDRFTKIARRLRWKLPFLAHGYNAAVAPVPEGDVDGAAQRAEAELMFKLDFFEYYMLLERALVHLMGVFGIRITGGFHGLPRTGSGVGATDVVGRGGGRSDHRFHANVLEALDDVRNPLHRSLGCDHVRYALSRAKELRNRWKNADDPDAALGSANNSNAAQTRPLTDYDLDRILTTIFAGFDEGHAVAQHYVAEVRAYAVAQRTGNNANANGMGVSVGVGVAGRPSMAGSVGSSANDMDMDWAEDEDEDGEGKWEFMTDAMDWQAV